MSGSRDDHGCGGCCPGAMGPQGPMGPQGLQGVIGPQGQAGSQGSQGVPGPVGAAGANGLDGLPGAQGSQGIQGVPGQMGLQGLPGQQGLQGQPGLAGSVGPMGPQGPQGLQGPQGVPGDCVECPCSCMSEFAEVYSQLPQVLAASSGPNLAGDVVKFEKTIVSTANIDASQASSLGKLKINLAGWYDVAAGMTGTLNPIPAPLPVWTLSLFLNGVILDGSTFSNVPLSPAQASNEITADTYVYCNAGDELTLANTSNAPVILSAPTLGTNAQTNSAYLKVVLLRAGPR